MTQSVQLGDYDYKIIVNVKDSAGAARDLSGATNLQIKLRAAISPVVKTFTATEEDLATGSISYTVEPGDIDALGTWEAQALWSLGGVPGQSQWVEVLDVQGTATATLIYAQVFATVADLIADKDSPGVNDARMYQAILDASEWVQKEVGWFIPVNLTRSFEARAVSRRLFIPPLLQLESITNDEVTLAAVDYVLAPESGFWPHGPYTQVIVGPEATQLRAWSCTTNAVVLAGLWGMYLRSATIDASVADENYQDDTQATLTVSNGGAVSPGMVLLIGSEQELVTGWGAPSLAITQLNGAIDASTEVITVDNGALLNIGEVLRVGFEQLRVRDIQGHECEVTRGWNGTRKTTHSDNAAVDAYRTVTVQRSVNGSVPAAHSNGTPLARYLVPNDILLLTKEIAMLSINKALGGYQGRTGNDDTGVVFYNDIFPRFDVKAIKDNYFIPRAN